MSMTDEEQQENQSRVDEALATLAEFFDTVLIQASKYEGSKGVTIIWSNRVGCPYSIYGQIKQLALQEEMEMETIEESVIFFSGEDGEEGEGMETD